MTQHPVTVKMFVNNVVYILTTTKILFLYVIKIDTIKLCQSTNPMFTTEHPQLTGAKPGRGARGGNHPLSFSRKE